MKLIDAFPSPATVCRCSTGTFGSPRSWMSTKLRLYNVYILAVFLYGVETWSITKAIEKSINNNNNSRISIPPSVVTSEAVIDSVV